MAAPKVLVADDEEGIRLVVTTLLRRAGMDVVQAADGDEALREAYRSRPDLVILDVNMPHRNGLDLARDIRRGEFALNAQVPIVFCTSDDRASVYEQSFDVAAQRFLVKPVDPNALLSCVDRLLRAA